MSRNTIWRADLRITGANGVCGTIELSAENMVTIREIRALCEKAITMCETLQAAVPEERQQWKPRVA
jgi:hypothetical protein